LKDRVLVHWHSRLCLWSVKRGSSPVEHHEELWLADCDFVVWAGGHARAVREQTRNVHAFCKGVLTPSAGKDGVPTTPVAYDYRRAATFVNAETGEPVEASPLVYLGTRTDHDGKVRPVCLAA
jgi:hypothetical protein